MTRDPGEGADSAAATRTLAEAQANLRDALQEARLRAIASDGWCESVLTVGAAAVDLAPADLPEISTALELLRELATNDSEDIREPLRGIAWYYVGTISLAQSDRTPSDHGATAEIYQRALRFLSRETDPGLWARMHGGIGIAYCEKLLANMETSWESYRSLLLAARGEFDAALQVLTADAFPEDHRELQQLRKWTIESLDKLNKRRSRWPAV